MKNRRFCTLIAAALTTVMIAGEVQGTTMYVNAAQKNSSVTAESTSSKEGKVKKIETVYVKLDANGNEKMTEVSAQLQNIGDLMKIEDVSDLQNIVNVKGEELFTQSGQFLMWDGNGSDICYQGTTDKELPVGIEITYEMDGKVMTPEELEGKTGHLKIRYEYQNMTGENEKNYIPFAMVTGIILDSDIFTNITVKNGKVISDGERQLAVGLGIPKMKKILETDQLDIPDYFEIEADVTEYENVEGITVATNDIFNEMSTDEIDSLDELKESMNQLQSAANELVDGTGALKDGLGTLLDSSDSMIDGIGKLSEGGNELASGTKSLSEGASELNKGAKNLFSGMNELYGGIAKLGQGIGSLKTNVSTAMNQLTGGANALKSGIDETASGASKLQGGIERAAQSAKTLSGAAAKLSSEIPSKVTKTVEIEKEVSVDHSKEIQILQEVSDACEDEEMKAQIKTVINDLKEQKVTVKEEKEVQIDLDLGSQRQMASQVAQGIGELASLLETQGQIGAGAAALNGALNGQLKEGAKSLSDGTAKLSTELEAGVEKLSVGAGMLLSGEDGNGGAKALKNGMSTLAKGSGNLAAGSKELENGSVSLASGLADLKTGSGKLKEGVTKLDEGASDLNDGMIRFNEEGIEELVSAFGTDTKVLLDKINGMLDASKEYKSFSGIADGMDGEVKFIFVMDK